MNIFLGNPPEKIKKWIINYYNRKQEEKRKVPLCFEAVDPGATIALNCIGNNLKTASFQTSTDGQSWSDYTYATSITLTNAGDKVCFRAKEDNTAIERTLYNYLQFTTTQEAKKVKVSGNIMSLLAPEFKDLIDLSTIRSGNPGMLQFYCLFIRCKNISDCGNLNLPATTLADSCYGGMFSDCYSLTKAPALPATTLASGCYTDMFSSCYSLTKAPALTATTLASGCYSNMFSSCYSLTQAPDLPAMTLADGCYSGMFSGCYSLTKAPELPATTLADYCYSYMFSDCQSLTQAPEIKNYTPDLQAYEEMLTGSFGKLTTCIWSDLTISEAESMILNEAIFGYDNPGDSVRISVTCKDGFGVAYYDSVESSWVFEL